MCERERRLRSSPDRPVGSSPLKSRQIRPGYVFLQCFLCLSLFMCVCVLYFKLFTDKTFPFSYFRPFFFANNKVSLLSLWVRFRLAKLSAAKDTGDREIDGYPASPCWDGCTSTPK